MATLPVQVLDSKIEAPTFTAASAGGDSFVNSENTFILAKNSDGSPHTVTPLLVGDSFKAAGYGRQATDALVISLAATTGEAVFICSLAGFSPGGIVSLNYDDETGITLAVVRIDR